MFTKDKKRNIFRQESLERLSSPEQLDQLIQVVGPKEWLPLTVLGSLIFIGLIWSIFGRIPINVQGRGILINPLRVVNFQSPISGQLQSFHAQPGECITKGTLVASIDPSDLKNKLKLTENKKAQLQQQYNEMSLMLTQGVRAEQAAFASSDASLEQRVRDVQALTPLLKDRGLDAINQERQSLQQRLRDLQLLTPILQTQGLEAIAKQRESLEKRLQDTQTVTPLLKDKGLDAIAQQRESVQQRLENAKQLVPVFAERLEKRQQLGREGAIAQDNILQAEQEYLQLQENVAELEAHLKSLNANEAEAQAQYLQNLNSIGEIEAQLKDLVVQETQARQRHLDNLNQISDIQAKLKNLEVQEAEAQQRYQENLNQIRELQTQRQKLDSEEKRMLQQNLEQLNTNKNQIEEVSREIIQLEAQIADNSQIFSPHAGCILEVTATDGQVVSPGTNLGVLNVNSEDNTVMGVTYFAVKDGKKIQPGMPLQITPDTVKREQFGGIVGEVTTVSQFPITQQGASTVIGNSDVVKSLIQGANSNSSNAIVEVRATLISDNTPSGYKWSSSDGPPLQITPGTTTTVRVRVEQRAPITFLLPILREWTGIY